MHLTFGWWLDKGDGTKPYYFDAFAVADGHDASGFFKAAAVEDDAPFRP